MLTTRWTVWTSPAHLILDTPSQASLHAATLAVHRVLDTLEQAVNTFDPTSELARINASGAGTYNLSPTLTQVLTLALTAYDTTAGAYDPRVPPLGGPQGHSLTLTPGTNGHLQAIQNPPASLHEHVQLSGNRLTLAPGVQLNLIGLGKAWAVDHGAAAAAHTSGAPTLLNIGGDIATAGPTRPWAVTVQDLETDPASTIELINGGAIATSSTQKRRWATDGHTWHHIINPATGLSTTPELKTASIIASSAAEANTYSTAAIVWGREAHHHLAPTGHPSRLITAEGQELTHHWPTNFTPRKTRNP
ncbi:FAD:protein FMN transferase [Rothia nasimurium]|uniref:FAD:protein FMN transferase n=1 Tax=Rothia nasimurium TaxID=85336 RepID=UPI003BA30089